jgi:hypothetical protein
MKRLNEAATECVYCGVVLRPGEGFMFLSRKRWFTICDHDRRGCRRRARARLAARLAAARAKGRTVEALQRRVARRERDGQSG